jgi:hypothetical protein
MATKKTPELEYDKKHALVLRDCVFGKAGEIVALTVADADTGAAQGMLDIARPASVVKRAD